MLPEFWVNYGARTWYHYFGINFPMRPLGLFSVESKITRIYEGNEIIIK